MKETINVMKRYEIKYILTKEQTEYLVQGLNGHMEVDQYGKTSICSLYYDTPNHRLIRESLDKPEYKEKCRLRSYGLAKPGKPVYLELKRKAFGIVYKRRIETSIDDVNKFFKDKKDIFKEGQIEKEITYFRNFYDSLVPSCLIIYDRVAYYEPDGDLRLTIDYNPRYRLDDLNLDTSIEGKSLLDEGSTILEIKVQEAIPIWLSSLLSNGKIFRGSFSKYGEAYKKEIQNVDRKESGSYV
ncbi:MAG: polyphosphate polymerase domain-containing protein [Acholeplasmatales bacterium]|nr:polyphosphate polymerase domain-containing protein [Acholeplasmatales bacterium]